MIDILEASSKILTEAGFTTATLFINERDVLAFEDATVLGFLFAYDDAAQLVSNWERDSNQIIAEQQLGLRRAGKKAWNTYTIFLAKDANDFRYSSILAAIEEDLSATRKIARAKIHDKLDLREALLALLPLQAAPKLEGVDMKEEIHQRATELPSRVIDAFLLAGEESAILHVLEEEA